MDYKEKIIALLNDKELSQEQKEKLETIFPELKESEDEKIRGAIIDHLKDNNLIEWAAWLEKQGKSSDQIHYWTEEEIEPIINDYLRGVEHYGGMIGRLRCLKPKSIEKQGSSSVKWQKNTLYNKPAINHSVLMKTIQGIAEGEWQGEHWFQYRWSWTLKDSDVLAWMELSDLSEQGEQKTAVTDFNAKDWYVSKVDGKIHDMTYNPADKVEPKFHKGEWIVWKNKCYKVNYNGCGYELIDQNGLSTWLEYGTVDTSARLYDVAKDAKDGDVVVDKSDGTIGIFESIGHHPDGGSYNDPSYCFLHCRYDDGYFFADFEDGNMMTSDDVIPATQEQRDTLEKAMADAGWKFDFDKKELKKIEDEIEIPFGAKDSELQESTYYIPDGFHAEIDDDKVIIKKGEKSAAWNVEDSSKVQRICKYLDEAKKYYADITEVRECMDWLKSLKQRIG